VIGGPRSPNTGRSGRNSRKEQRLEQITQYVLKKTSVRVQDLAETFHVSLMTAHRYLDDLEDRGIVRKVRGGATVQPSSLFESDVRYRLTQATREKEAIARQALSHVEPGASILMDDSTTTLMLARLIPTIPNVTVITNCLSIMREVNNAKGIQLIALGGTYLPRYDGFAGVLCEQAIASVRADVLFMSTSAVSSGIAFHQEEQMVKVKKAMMASAGRRILLVDHTKLGKVALHRLAPLGEFDLVIIDSDAKSETLRELQDAGARVEVAPL
jgi:DeoR/GlpR family transcriptional regulator of sugar metabolism